MTSLGRFLQPSVSSFCLLAPAIAFTNVTVITTEGAAPNLTVVVQGDRITSVGPAASAVLPSGARRVDGTGKFLLPGLWDMHTHVTAFGRDRLPLFLIHGVTAVRDLGADPDSIFRWASAVASGKLVGPRIVAAGATLSGPSSMRSPGTIAVTTAAEARAAVRLNHDRGATLIKVWSTIPREAYFATIDEARQRGLSVVGHLPVDVSLKEAVEAGQRDFEHSIGFPIAFSPDEEALLAELRRAVHGTLDLGEVFGILIRTDGQALDRYDPARAATALAQLAQQGVWVCPTLTDSRAYTVMADSMAGDPRLRYLPPALRERWIADARAMSAGDLAGLGKLFPAALRTVGDLHRAGVRLLAGTDAGSLYDLPGFDLHTELALLVRAGLTPLEALQTATRNAAEAAGLGAELGRVAPNQRADLLLLAANPLDDIGNTRRIAGVMSRGRWLDAKALERIRARLLVAP